MLPRLLLTLESLTDIPERYAAPRIEFVAPDENVRIGMRVAALSIPSAASRRVWYINIHSADINVPSFCVKNKGQDSPRRFMARWNSEMVRRVKPRIEALRIDALSRSKKPT